MGDTYPALLNVSQDTITLASAYNTTANGWCDDLVVEPGQAIACIQDGNGYYFAKYLIVNLKKSVNMDVTFVNMTPHPIKLNDGRVFEPSGNLVRVGTVFGEFDKNLICESKPSEVEGLPEPKDGVLLIVPNMVLQAARNYRNDLVAPATGHPDTIRNKKGWIVSVPGFVNS